MRTLLALAVIGFGAQPAMSMQASPMGARNTLNDQQFYAERLQRQQLDGPTERGATADPDQNPRRARRAQAAAALINAGDCQGALQLARRERDQRLASRIDQVCGATTVSDPSTEAQASAGGRS